MPRLNKIINILMLVVYIGHFTGTTFFIHQHRLTNGIIVHSHPYKNPHHGHSTHQFQTIDLLQDRTSTEAVDFSLPSCAQLQHPTIPAVDPHQSPIVNGAAVSQLRAPPTL